MVFMKPQDENYIRYNKKKTYNLLDIYTISLDRWSNKIVHEIYQWAIQVLVLCYAYHVMFSSIEKKNCFVNALLHTHANEKRYKNTTTYDLQLTITK